MSRTWRNSWGPELKARESRGADNWKQDLWKELEDMSDETFSVFVIVNEWTPEGSQNSSSEIVGNRFFDTEDSAWEHLSDIAESFGVELSPAYTSFPAPPESGIDEQSFFIDELWSN